MAGEFSARFANVAAEERYDQIVIRKNIWEEQGFKYDDGLDNYGLETIIHKRLYDLGWSADNLPEPTSTGQENSMPTSLPARTILSMSEAKEFLPMLLPSMTY
ncbi:hypothetical protein V6N12_030045 [Hibiscus sabdariffa]|uniref:Uncharacterized protein n=1 Tax=Hibiscus sabdariffa TaxID=183260 RepID=A0ABR2CJ71_9ROSI